MAAAILKYTVVTFGYKELVGIIGSGGIDRVKKELKNYNLYSVLQVCAKASSLLVAKGITNPLTQAELLAAYFPLETRLKYYEIARVKAEGSPWVIFYEQNYLTLVKIALEVCSQNEGGLVKPEDLSQVGNWLLIINEQMYADEIGGGLIIPYANERERLRAALSRYYFFMAAERLAYKLGRYYWFVKYFRANRPQGVDIDKWFIDATGDVSLDDYIAVLGSLLVKWVNIPNKEIPSEEWITCLKRYFSESKLSKAIIEKTFDLIAISVEDFSSEYDKYTKEVLKGKDSYFYNFLPLMQKPLIWNESKECFVCPYVGYLYDKATEGIYRTIETSLHQKNELKKRDTFSVAWGEAFEVYSNEALSGAFQDSYTPNIRDSGTQYLDGLLVSPNYAFLIEIKSFNWTFESLVTGSNDSMEYSLKNLFASYPKKKGLGQLKRFIDLFKSGKIKTEQKIADKYFIPTLIVSNDIPMDAYNRHFYEKISIANGTLPAQIGVLPFIILTIEEIEILEAIATEKSREEALNILAEYSHLFTKRNKEGYVENSLPFKNFLYERGYERVDQSSNNARLLSEFHGYVDIVTKKSFNTVLDHTT